MVNLKKYLIILSILALLAWLSMTLDKDGIAATQANENLSRAASSTANYWLVSGGEYTGPINPYSENMSSSVGNFTIPKIDAPNGGIMDDLARIVDVRNTTRAVIDLVNNRTNPDSSNSSYPARIGTISYTPKFVCGTISSNNGPLRPGYYDTDISIFNKQNYPIRILWNVVVSDGPSSNAIIKELSAETSTKISCSDLSLVMSDGAHFLEGFVVIVLPISGNILGAFPDISGTGGSILRPVDDSNGDLIDVQVFYTANALPQLPQNIIIENIAFQVLDDPSSRIPKTSLNHELEISFVSDPNKLYNPENRIKMILAQEHGMSDIEVNGIRLKIDRTNVVTSYQQDDHAISSSRIKPVIRYAN